MNERKYKHLSLKVTKRNKKKEQTSKTKKIGNEGREARREERGMEVERQAGWNEGV